MGVMLSERGINDCLRNLVEHLEDGNFEQATAVLYAVDFERINALSDGFGEKRVRETVDHIRACARAVAAREIQLARAAACAAEARWRQPIQESE